MKKKIIIALVLLVVVFAAVVALALYNANYLVARFKPQLEAQASRILDTPVAIGEMETALIPNIRIKVKELSIGANKTSQSEGLKLKDLALEVKLIPLLSKQLEITKLVIESPRITAIKDAEGVSIEGLPKKSAQQPAQAASNAAAEAVEPKTATSGDSKMAIKLEGFEVKDAEVHYKDLVANKTYELKNINVSTKVALEGDVAKVKDLALDALVMGKAQLSAKSNELTFNTKSGVLVAPEINLKALGNPIELAMTFDTRAKSGNASVKSGAVTIQSFAPLFDLLPPAVGEMQPRGTIQPDIKATFGAGGTYRAAGTIGLKDVALDTAGKKISDLAGTLQLEAAPQKINLRAEDLALAMNGAPLKVKTALEIIGNDATISALSVSGFGGNIGADARLNLGNPLQFSSNSTITNLQIEQALRAADPNAAGKLAGTLTKVTTTIAGNTGPNLMSSLHGSTNVQLDRGVLKGVNIAGKVLKAANNIPLIGGALYNLVPPEKRNLVDSEDTEIKSLTGTFNIGGGGMTTNNLRLISVICTIDARGRINFDSSVDLNAVISFEKEFSQSLAIKVKEVRKILDADGRLTLPLAISGTPPKLLIVPDLTKVLEIGARKVIQEKATELLGNALKNEGRKRGLGLLGF